MSSCMSPNSFLAFFFIEQARPSPMSETFRGFFGFCFQCSLASPEVGVIQSVNTWM
jgi:hypothetical protein